MSTDLDGSVSSMVSILYNNFFYRRCSGLFVTFRLGARALISDFQLQCARYPNKNDTKEKRKILPLAQTFRSYPGQKWSIYNFPEVWLSFPTRKAGAVPRFTHPITCLHIQSRTPQYFFARISAQSRQTNPLTGNERIPPSPRRPRPPGCFPPTRGRPPQR